MESELSLRILPELSDLTKAIDRITKSISKGLSKAIESPLNKLKDKFKMELDIGTKIAGPKLPQSSLKEMGKKNKRSHECQARFRLKASQCQESKIFASKLLPFYILFTFCLIFCSILCVFFFFAL